MDVDKLNEIMESRTAMRVRESYALNEMKRWWYQATPAERVAAGLVGEELADVDPRLFMRVARAMFG